MTPRCQKEPATATGRVSLSFLMLVLLLGGLVTGAHLLDIRLCLFRRLTGYPCPTCGSTRAVVHLLKGEWGRAFARQPLASAALLGGLLFFLVYLLLRAFGLKNVRIPPRLIPNKWFLFLLGGILVIANWIYIIRLGN